MPFTTPGRILLIQQQSQRVARVQLGGVDRHVFLDFVPEAQVGDYVIVHLGYAISLMDSNEAERTYELSESLAALEEEEHDASSSADLKT